MPVRLHHAAAEVGARLVLLGDAPIAPGAEGRVQLVLEQPIAAAVGDRFVLRDTSAQRTIGGGRFLDLRAPARKRRTPERLAQLEAHAIAEPEQALAALLDRPPLYLDLDRLRARPRAWRQPRSKRSPSASASCACRRSDTVFALVGGDLAAAQAQPARRRSRRSTPPIRICPGSALERLRLQLEPRLPAPAFAAVLQALAREREIALDGAWVRLPGHEVRLTPQDEQLWGADRPAAVAAPNASVRRACATSPASSARRRPRSAGC